MNCVILHGCPSNIEKAMNPMKRTYNKHWIPWIKMELEKKGIKTETPIMPSAWEPDYNEWKKDFDKLKINKDTTLIGHSCGCAFLVRWLGDTGKKIKKLILVAPWKIPPKNNLKKKLFYEYEINKDIKNRIEEIIIFTSDDEEENGKKSVQIFYNALGGKVIELKGKGHYVLEDMGNEEFPELLEEILK